MSGRLTEKKFILLGGTYSNKGGEAIVRGTLKTLRKIGVSFEYIVDPDPLFPNEFYKEENLIPIFRWSKSFLKYPEPLNKFIAVLDCLKKSNDSRLKDAKVPIWYVGDSSLNDYHSVLSLMGQTINLLSLKKATGGKLVINASLGYTRTKIGEYILKLFLKNCDYFFVRGRYSLTNLKRLGVNPSRISIICDFAFHLERMETERTKRYLKIIKDQEIPAVGLIFKPIYRIRNEDYLGAIRKVYETLSKDYRIFFIPTSYSHSFDENDLVFLERFGLKPILNIKSYTPEEIISIFSGFEFVITTRLHGGVFSILAEVPTIHIYEADNSLDVIGDTFGDLLPLIHISEFLRNPDRVIEEGKRLIQMRDEIAKEMHHRIKRNLKNSIDVLKSVLDML